MEKVLLGKSDWKWTVRWILAAPFWALSTSPTRKSWSEFKYGMMTHVCDWNYENPDYSHGGKCYPCKHFGCNMVSVQEKDGTWCK
ncbi:MAG: hypothetical protein WC979_03075 [Candidatus Pacearchaeota archaeon]|jgi:hypothetical protein|nr:hypothetical protein [Clostridia bacterium]